MWLILTVTKVMLSIELGRDAQSSSHRLGPAASSTLLPAGASSAPECRVSSCSGTTLHTSQLFMKRLGSVPKAGGKVCWAAKLLSNTAAHRIAPAVALWAAGTERLQVQAQTGKFSDLARSCFQIKRERPENITPYEALGSIS